MDEHNATRTRIALVRHEEDVGVVKRGMFVPLSIAKRQQKTPMIRPIRSLLVLAMLLLAVVSSGFLLQSQNLDLAQIAAPLAMGASPALLFKTTVSEREVPLRYGPAPLLSDATYYGQVQEQLASGGATFLDIDVLKKQVRYFERGVLKVSGSLLAVPEADSWCSVPAGFYQVEDSMVEHTSTYISATLPYSLTFGPNYFIHGWPTVASTSVAEDFDRDCLRLDSGLAKSLYTYVRKGTPVVVQAPAVEKKELFSFESRVPNFSTPQYLIADLKSDTLLAVGNKHTARPIASLTKLMTALVVLENLPLDRQVSVQAPSLIETLVPRLLDRNKVSVHALLQLLLVESSNEAAEVLAEAVGREEFIAQMNEQAAKLGMVDTHFTDPSGVDAGNVSTVHDLWWLTRYIYDHYPLIFTFTRNEQAPPAYVSDAFADLINFNKVEFVDSFVGGKIGETTAAGQTSVTLHRLQINGEERDIGIILLGSTGRRADVVKLLQYIGDRFEP